MLSDSCSQISAARTLNRYPRIPDAGGYISFSPFLGFHCFLQENNENCFSNAFDVFFVNSGAQGPPGPKLNQNCSKSRGKHVFIAFLQKTMKTKQA